MEFSLPIFENAFYKDGLSICQSYVNNPLTLNSILRLTKTIYLSIDELIELFIGQCKQQYKKIDCKKGCGFCCHQCILVNPHELFYIYEFVIKNFSKIEIKDIQQKAKLKFNKTNKMKAEEFVHFKYPCPFLVNNECSIYNARPMACRIYLSADIKSCENEFNSPENFDIFPNLYELPLKAGRRLNEGVVHTLTENFYSMAEIKLEEAIILMLDNKNLLHDWLNKKPVFKSYRLNESDTSYLNKFSK